MKLTPVAKKQLVKILGSASVLTDELSLALYAYDCSLSRTRPEGVLLINKCEQIAPVLRVLHQYHIPFVPRASATNHAGSCVPLQGGVILNLTALDHVLEINTKQQFALVEPGVITADLQERLAPLGYFYAPDPASQRVCTLGGNMAQNASGARCLKYGGTLDHVLAADFVLADGTEVSLSRQDAGPDFIGLLCGSEGTLGVLTKLKVRILPLVKQVRTFLISFPSLQNSVEVVSELTAQGIIPRCLEAMDKLTAQSVEAFSHAGYPTEAEALLILELDGTLANIERETQLVEKTCRHHKALQVIFAKTEEERQKLWKGRRNAFAAMSRLAPSVMVGDGTVPRSNLPQALKRVQQVLQNHHAKASLLFHAGDGNFHPHLLFDERNQLQTVRTTRVLREILKICVDEQGTLSGEHGIGVEKRALMAYQYDVDTLSAMARIKQVLDPQNLSNPLKIFPHQFTEKAREPMALRLNVQVLQDTLLSYIRAKEPFFICGQNSQLKTKASTLLSAKTLQEIIEIDTANYTVTAQAGVTLNTLYKALHKAGIYSILPDGKGTLGGAFCSGKFPEFYAHVIGIEALLPDGSCVHYGGKLMKNAAGYHLTRLLAGSQGTLGLVTQLTFRVFAHPQTVLKAKPVQQKSSNFLWKRIRDGFDPSHLILNCKEEKARA